jgi:hypothetical protein
VGYAHLKRKSILRWAQPTLLFCRRDSIRFEEAPQQMPVRGKVDEHPAANDIAAAEDV